MSSRLKIDNFHGKSKLNFWTKNEDFEQCGFFQSIQPTVRKGEALMDEEDDFSSDDQSDDSDHRHGIWMRRRRLDGALNRVPVGFYSKVWMILENCRGILVRGRTLDTFLTQGVSKIFAKFFNLSQIHRFFLFFR